MDELLFPGKITTGLAQVLPFCFNQALEYGRVFIPVLRYLVYSLKYFKVISIYILGV